MKSSLQPLFGYEMAVRLALQSRDNGFKSQIGRCNFVLFFCHFRFATFLTGVYTTTIQATGDKEVH